MTERNEKTKFLEWFVGFAEGDGSWQTEETKLQCRSIFVINQKNPQVLYKIKSKLGYGTITGPYSQKNPSGTISTYYRYRVGDFEGTRNLVEIFNGELVLDKTRERFAKYLEVQNRRACKPTFNAPVIALIDSAMEPSLSHGWLSGFIDAEGCFSHSFSRNVSSDEIASVKLRFTLPQKGEKRVFDYLQSILGGSLGLEGSEGYYRLEVSGQNDLKRIIDYLGQNGLYSVKSIALARFKKIYYRLTDGKFRFRMLSRRSRARFVRLCRDINKNL